MRRRAMRIDLSIMRRSTERYRLDGCFRDGVLGRLTSVGRSISLSI